MRSKFGLYRWSRELARQLDPRTARRQSHGVKKSARVERLEDRTLLSANITAAIAGNGNLIITDDGNNTPGDITIHASASTPGALEVVGQNGTSINGTLNGSATFALSSIQGTLFINLLGGTNSVEIDGTGLGSLPLNFDIQFNNPDDPNFHGGQGTNEYLLIHDVNLQGWVAIQDHSGEGNGADDVFVGYNDKFDTSGVPGGSTHLDPNSLYPDLTTNVDGVQIYVTEDTPSTNVVAFANLTVGSNAHPANITISADGDFYSPFIADNGSYLDLNGGTATEVLSVNTFSLLGSVTVFGTTTLRGSALNNTFEIGGRVYTPNGSGGLLNPDFSIPGHPVGSAGYAGTDTGTALIGGLTIDSGFGDNVIIITKTVTGNSATQGDVVISTGEDDDQIEVNDRSLIVLGDNYLFPDFMAPHTDSTFDLNTRLVKGGANTFNGALYVNTHLSASSVIVNHTTVTKTFPSTFQIWADDSNLLLLNGFKTGGVTNVMVNGTGSEIDIYGSTFNGVAMFAMQEGDGHTVHIEDSIFNGKPTTFELSGFANQINIQTAHSGLTRFNSNANFLFTDAVTKNGGGQIAIGNPTNTNAKVNFYGYTQFTGAQVLTTKSVSFVSHKPTLTLSTLTVVPAPTPPKPPKNH